MGPNLPRFRSRLGPHRARAGPGLDRHSSSCMLSEVLGYPQYKTRATYDFNGFKTSGLIRRADQAAGARVPDGQLRLPGKARSRAELTEPRSLSQSGSDLESAGTVTVRLDRARPHRPVTGIGLRGVLDAPGPAGPAQHRAGSASHDHWHSLSALAEHSGLPRPGAAARPASLAVSLSVMGLPAAGGSCRVQAAWPGARRAGLGGQGSTGKRSSESYLDWSTRLAIELESGLYKPTRSILREQGHTPPAPGQRDGSRARFSPFSHNPRWASRFSG